MFVSVQVSFYPLGEDDLASAVDRFVSALDERGLPYEVGAMSTVVWGDVQDIFDALRNAYERGTGAGAAVMTATVSNACPACKTS